MNAINMIGKIVIKDNKVCFEYHTFPKPYIGTDEYKLNLKLHEASKQAVGISNVDNDGMLVNRDVNGEPEPAGIINNNQKCEAEIVNNKVVMIKIQDQRAEILDKAINKLKS